MVEKGKNWISVGAIYACSVIGVGFASGNEILHFFTSYGMKGFLGVLTSSVLFSVTGFMIVRICYKTGSHGITDCYKSIGGSLFASFAGFFGTAFSFSLFMLMSVAWNDIAGRLIPVPAAVRTLIYILLFFLYGVFNIQNKKIAGWMRFLILFGTGMVLFTVAAAKLKPAFFVFHITEVRSWLLSAIFYVGYNSFVSADCLCKACEKASSEKSALLGGVAGGAVLFVFSFVFNLIFTFWYRGKNSFPLLELAGEELDWVRVFFTGVLMLCILYSGFNAGMIVIERTLKRIPLSKTVATVFLGSLTLFVLPVRFDAFLQNVYPLFGLAGSCIVICLLFLWMFQKNR